MDIVVEASGQSVGVAGVPVAFEQVRFVLRPAGEDRWNSLVAPVLRNSEDDGRVEVQILEAAEKEHLVLHDRCAQEPAGSNLLEWRGLGEKLGRAVHEQA